MIIFPAIDMINGKCVRLSQGSFSESKIYHEQPIEVAKSFADAGFTHLHLVDLDGAKSGKPMHLNILERMATETNLMIDFGGGLNTKQFINEALNAGAAKVNIGSAAVKFPLEFAEWLQLFGSEKIILSADVKNELIQMHAWQQSSDLKIADFLHEKSLIGLRYATITDILKDGMLQGTSLSLYEHLVKTFPDMHIIASGGVSSIEDLSNLSKIGCYGAIVGKAIYESKISLTELQNWMQNA